MCPGCDSKQSDGEDPVLELWGMWSTPSLPLLPGPFWSRVIIPNSLIYGSNGTVKPLNYAKINDWCQIGLLEPLNCVERNEL